MTTSQYVAMENALFSDSSLDWDARCAEIAEAGFHGVYAVSYPINESELERLRTLNESPSRHGLRLAAVYANIDLGLPPDHPVNSLVGQLFNEQEGAPRVELSIKCSDSARLPRDLDSAIALRLEPLLKVSEKRGFDVALYPHSFYPLETPAQAARLVNRLGHRRLRFVFPLSHVFAVSTPEEALRQLSACAKQIESFNFCGCRRIKPEPPAKCVNLPPDEGVLEIAPFFNALTAASYAGDLIVQGHGWNNGRDGLRRTILYLKTLS